MTDRSQIERRLRRIESLIEEAEARLGAHSVKPLLMQQLFDLEEERDALLAQLKALAEQGGQ